MGCAVRFFSGSRALGFSVALMRLPIRGRVNICAEKRVEKDRGWDVAPVMFGLVFFVVDGSLVLTTLVYLDREKCGIITVPSRIRDCVSYSVWLAFPTNEVPPGSESMSRWFCAVCTCPAA